MLTINKKAVDYSHSPRKFGLVPMLSKMDRPAGQREARIRQAFLDVPMYLSHDSLADIAKSKGIDVRELKNGDFLLFINSSWDKVKLLGPQRVIVYISAPAGQRISHLFLRDLPKVFNSSSRIVYDEALKPHLMKYLEDRSSRRRKRVQSV